MKREGSICILAALLIVVVCAIFALAVDLGFLCLARTELQRAADSASLAGAASLFVKPTDLDTNVYNPNLDTLAARNEVRRFVNENWAAHHKGTLDVDLNLSNAVDGDIVTGRWNRADRTFEPDDFDAWAVRVRIPMIAAHKNGQVFLPFGFISDFADTNAMATAIVKYPVLLPFATSVPNWNKVKGDPDFTIFPDSNWDESNGLPPGNFGALRIGSGGTSTLMDHIDHGPSASDLAAYGGELYDGLVIPGATGIKAGMEPAFVGGTANGESYSGIIGESRYLPLYGSVSGNGANANFVIKRFVGVRIKEVSLKSGKKWIKLEPINSVSDLFGLQIVE